MEKRGVGDLTTFPILEYIMKSLSPSPCGGFCFKWTPSTQVDPYSETSPQKTGSASEGCCLELPITRSVAGERPVAESAQFPLHFRFFVEFM